MKVTISMKMVEENKCYFCKNLHKYIIENNELLHNSDIRQIMLCDRHIDIFINKEDLEESNTDDFRNLDLLFAIFNKEKPKEELIKEGEIKLLKVINNNI